MQQRQFGEIDERRFVDREACDLVPLTLAGQVILRRRWEVIYRFQT